MADERRIAHRLTDAGRIVDLRRQQHRPACIEPTRRELVEMGLVAHPMAVRYWAPAKVPTASSSRVAPNAMK
jgi:hypothetical protein